MRARVASPFAVAIACEATSPRRATTSERGVSLGVMRTKIALVTMLPIVFLLAEGCAQAGDNCTRRARATEGGDPVTTAQAFLDSLGYDKYDAATFRFDDVSRKSKWSNLPD